MSARPRVGLLGGSFDPIHAGHVAAAAAAQQAVTLDRVRIIPSARPPHRTDSPRASGYHRLQMIKLAVADRDGWEASDLELRRDGPSFTFDTLSAFHRDGCSPLQLFCITGADAFAEIATWYRYPELLDSAHFVVVARPGTALTSLPNRLPALARRMITPQEVSAATATRIILLEADTPDVSSTDVRRRVAAGESLDGLVSPAVAAYIAQHSLYRVVPESSSVNGR